MNYKKIFSLICVFTLLISNLLSQEIQIQGKVIADDNKYPIPGVNIVIKGTNDGTITDLDGNYSLVADKDATLIYSFIGYQSQEIPVNGQTRIDVRMQTDVTELEETVVIGYGTQKKSDLTGAISTVGEDALKNKAFANVSQALQGKASGVEIINNSGAPGSSMTMRIRGMGTLNSGAEPLYVIDGFIQGDQNFGKENGERPDNKVGIAFLDPADIESVEILKDASAAAIYGARGANGVVLITTKKGKQGKTRVDLNIQTGMQYLPHKYDIMNAQEFRKYKNTFQTRLGRDTLEGFENSAEVKNFDWQDFVFDPASKQKYKLTLSGGSEKSTYLVSGSYFKQNGIVKNSGLDKYSFRINTDQKIGEKIKTGQNIIITYTERERINENGAGVNASPIANALKADPSASAYYTDEEMDSLEIDKELNWGNWRELERTSSVTNPASNLDRKTYTYESWNYYGTAFLDIEIFSFLNFRSTIGLNMTTGHMEEFEPFYKVNSVEKTPQTIFRLRNEKWLNWDSENTLTFNKIFGKHDLKAMAGFTAQKEQFVDTRHTVVDFPYLDKSMRYMNINDLSTMEEMKSSPMAYAMSSLLGRIMYSFDNKLLVTASIRRDGSSYFAEEFRFGYFPSFSAGYKISEEPFMEKYKDIINLLKIRVGYGELGNASIRPNLYNALMTNETVGAAFGNPKTFYTGAMPEGLTNEDVRWETTKQKNMAIDMAFWDDKLTFTFDYFRKNTEDLLIAYPLPKISGAQNFERVGGDVPPLYVNAASMSNEGFEISTGYKISLGRVNMNINANISHIKNIVESLANGLPIQSNQVREFGNYISKTIAGYPVAQFYGYVVEGIYQDYDEIKNHLAKDAANLDPYTYDRTEEPKPLKNIAPGDYKFKDLDDNGIINQNDRAYIGNPLPDFTYGGSFDADYKFLDFSVYFNGVYGNDVVNVMDFYLASYGGTNKIKEYADTWSEDNPDAKYPRMETDKNNNRRFSTAYIEDGSYLRISNITLGATLRASNKIRKYVRHARIYFSVNNVYTFTKYSTGYPEVGSSLQYSAKPLDFGVDRGVYPLPRVFMIGANISF